MKYFPQIPYRIPKYATQLSSIRGVNMTDNAVDGDLAECKGLSFRRYPYFTTRPDRTRRQAYDNAYAMTVCNLDGIVTVRGGHLYYNATDCGEITNSAKQFAVVNTKLVIWPDKKYLDLTDMTVKSLGAKAEKQGAVFTTSTITVTWPVDFRDLFEVGDVVSISGCAQSDNNKSAQILGVAQLTLTFQANVFAAAEETGTITIERAIPDLDYIVGHSNRLWGCSNSTKTVYASALGSPTNFNVFNGLSTDSYALAISSNGNFTGCSALGSSVLIWKNHELLKILGETPAQFTLYSYDVEGVMYGCHKSQAIINDVLYYVGSHGVYAYGGSSPQLISPTFGDYAFGDSVGGTDGKDYYLSIKQSETKWDLWVFDTQYGMWLRQDELRVMDFARVDDTLYMLTPFIDSETSTVTSVFTQRFFDAGTGDWYAQFVPFYGGPQKKGQRQATTGKKRYSDLLIRYELADGSYLRADVRYDGERWYRVGDSGASIYETQSNKSGVKTMQIKVQRCDKLELRLSGEGDFALLAIVLHYYVGSEK